MNEPRCEVEGCVDAETRASLIGAWVDEMAGFVHSLDRWAPCMGLNARSKAVQPHQLVAHAC